MNVVAFPPMRRSWIQVKSYDRPRNEGQIYAVEIVHADDTWDVLSWHPYYQDGFAAAVAAADARGLELRLVCAGPEDGAAA